MIMRDGSERDEHGEQRFEAIWPVDDFEAASRFLHEVLSLDEPEAQWPDGPRLADFILMDRLGEGGSGVAYLARRVGSQQLATIKIFKQVGDHRVASRELEALSHTNCPVVPQLYEVDEWAGHLYVAYEYADGVSLTEHADRSCGSLWEKVRLLADVARAMQSMHEQGLIHRDIKPSNIIVTNDRRVQFVDFGTAAVMQTRQLNRWTLEGEMLGTPGYMSPEQARGEHSRLTIRSDIYSLGAIAYRLLTGDLPHAQDAAYAELVRQAGHELPRHPRQLNPQLPRALGAVLQKAVSLDASERFATAIQFAEELERWLDGRPIQTVPTPWWQRVWLAGKRNPKLAAAAGIAVAAVITSAVLTGVAVTKSKQAALQEELAETRQKMIERNRATMVSGMERIVEQLNKGNFVDAFKLLKLLELQAIGPEGSSDVSREAASLVAQSRKDFVRDVLRHVFGEEVIDDPEHLEPLNKLLTDLNRTFLEQATQERTDSLDA